MTITIGGDYQWRKYFTLRAERKVQVEPFILNHLASLLSSIYYTALARFSYMFMLVDPCYAAARDLFSHEREHLTCYRRSHTCPRSK